MKLSVLKKVSRQKKIIIVIPVEPSFNLEPKIKNCIRNKLSNITVKLYHSLYLESKNILNQYIKKTKLFMYSMFDILYS